jgi:hypothetical protein
MLRRVALATTDVSKERSASMMEALRSFETSDLSEPYVVTSQKTAFFIVITVKISNHPYSDFILNSLILSRKTIRFYVFFYEI